MRMDMGAYREQFSFSLGSCVARIMSLSVKGAGLLIMVEVGEESPFMFSSAQYFFDLSSLDCEVEDSKLNPPIRDYTKGTLAFRISGLVLWHAEE